ncbi:MAG: YdcH family protein [Geminicoccaceae bacterium]
MPMREHVESLRSKHARLEQLIEEELHRPLPDQSVISRLKKEKLRIKEQIERIRGANDRSDPVPTH